jgi:hypothetical protein
MTKFSKPFRKAYHILSYLSLNIFINCQIIYLSRSKILKLGITEKVL